MDAQYAYTTLPASDLDRAKAFFAEKLGLEPVEESPAGAFYDVGGSRVFLFPSSGAASGTHTQLGIRVIDIKSTVGELKGRGVVFEEYPDLTVDGIADTGRVYAAWFKDSEGNLLGVTQLKT